MSHTTQQVTTLYTVVVCCCLCKVVRIVYRCYPMSASTDTKDDINSTNEDHHMSAPPNPLENEDFERIENPSYQHLEMCHEKVTYSNL